MHLTPEDVEQIENYYCETCQRRDPALAITYKSGAAQAAAAAAAAAAQSGALFSSRFAFTLAYTHASAMITD